MKKKYIQPSFTVIELEAESAFLATSGIETGGDPTTDPYSLDEEPFIDWAGIEEKYQK